MTMTQTEVETVLFRLGVAFPGWRGDAIEQKARVQEWLDSKVSGYSLAVALDALAELKETTDKHPSIAQFLDACRRAARRREPDRALAAPDDGPVTEPADALARIAGIRDVVKSVPPDERPARPFQGALIHDRTSS